MNRRGFLSQMLLAGAAFTILPPATTYSRIWVARKPELVAYYVEWPEYNCGGILMPAHNGFYTSDFVKKINSLAEQLGDPRHDFIGNSLLRGAKVHELYNYSD